MKRWIFNFAFAFAAVFWAGMGVTLGFYGVEIGILLLGKTSQTSKFMGRREARKIKKGLQLNCLMFGGAQAVGMLYFLWRKSWQVRYVCQLGVSAIFFAVVTGFTHYTFKQKYMQGAAAAAAAAGPPPPYSAK